MFNKKNTLDSNTQGLKAKSEALEKKSKNFYSLSLIGSDCFIEGKIHLKGEARIAGRVEGIIHSEDLLTLENSAKVKGEVHGSTIELSGEVEGEIHASHLLWLTSKAHVKGDIVVAKLVVEEGATLNGKVTYTQETLTSSSLKHTEQKQPRAIS